uniref:Uncharacterized protein n=1 Tax=Chromera velia CCMP2878 TaxID=1169474 RepID=A0A0G4I0S9_9ALVE|eukprot:Cvel_34521.t1-p1 / transcript=Cvel_34521.t1 / gene=Cvel_34521 / organism=Chromera_velia_CCMP2878 / gene_product=hypothetical protein / transcript_product=hypothetical protein / location=Cvel_scaffold5960:1862-3164(+) / protein_length=226 / sequence_SO=supercontig / SO=protein_coding / is_pseudo=false
MVEDPELASSLAEEMRSFQTFQNAIEKFRNEQNRLHEHAAFLLQQLDESKSSTRAATDENPNSKSSDFEGGVAGAFGTDPFLLNQSQRPEQGQTVVRSVVPGHDHIGSFRPAQREGNSQMSADNFGSVLQTQAGSSYRRRSVPHQRVRVSGAKTEGAVEDAVLRMQEQLVDIQETSGEQAKEAIRTMLNSVKLPPAQAVAVAKKLKKMLKVSCCDECTSVRFSLYS